MNSSNRSQCSKINIVLLFSFPSDLHDRKILPDQDIRMSGKVTHFCLDLIKNYCTSKSKGLLSVCDNNLCRNVSFFSINILY